MWGRRPDALGVSIEPLTESGQQACFRPEFGCERTGSGVNGASPGRRCLAATGDNPP